MDSTPSTPVRGHLRLVGKRRISHGLYDDLVEDQHDDAQFVSDLKAYLLVLPESAVFTSVTAARVLGWRLPQLPDHVPVFAAVHQKDRRPRRAGLVCSRLVGPREAQDRRQLPLDTPTEILLRAARDFGVLDVVIMIDSALQLGHLDPEAMEQLLRSGRPGVRVLRAAWRLSHRQTESAGETVLRVLHRVLGVLVEPQAVLHDDEGRVVGRADLRLTGTRRVHEYDGGVHRDKAQHRADLRRERGLREAAYERGGYTLDDLLNHPVVVMHEIDRALDRPHDVRRLDTWRRLVEDSMYGATGRARVRDRWRRWGDFVVLRVG
ncbi:hypothetical protein I601_3313 [Nocardioides dokdonensis FR1436]|uniref:DUF559 domain-containing protein n=1 Tax=Nocardioides dokdonensis FR1436 TaxID=1300347 RepID=A0A1A9GPX8_9ACTN|nr:hypothetical protein [Nocardioides dokdonensis]ANH39720.1 hypothetical protein I601_3313 [Nocardioides dokdonensis FR1436]